MEGSASSAPVSTRDAGRPAAATGGHRLQRLAGRWSVAPDPGNEGRAARWCDADPPQAARPAPVPGIIAQAFPGHRGVAWYWHTFTPAITPGLHERALLRFGAVDYLADVWLNGTHVGGHEGAETPFLLEVTGAVRAGAPNRLVVRVLVPTDEPIDGFVLAEVPHRSKRDKGFRPGMWLNFGGILGDVDLLIVPAVRIADVFVRPEVATGRLVLAVTVQNDAAAGARGWLTAATGPAASVDTEDSVSAAADFPPGESAHELTLAIQEPRLWSPDDPFLYRVTTALGAVAPDGATVHHEHRVRCGFRDFRVVSGFFRLNGKRVLVRSAHTANHCPIGLHVSPDRDRLRRDLVYAKASGFNTVRFLGAVPTPEQLDLCDEMGLMIYEECHASWLLADSPHLTERYRRSVREMVLRDRNHPCVVMWGLLNETPDGPVFRQAAGFLPYLRALDPTRLVLLNSGRFDAQPSIGSASNPGSATWEHLWGVEAPDATPTPADRRLPSTPGSGHFHFYPQVPHTAETKQTLRTLGQGTKPVFLGEYGIGSLPDVVHTARVYEQVGARPDLEDAVLFRSMAATLAADLARYGMTDVYPFPADLLLDSQRRHARWRRLGFDLVRANPHICGVNLTGLLDQSFTGQGMWTFWRDWKPGIVDALSDGWAPLRWCLFVEPRHAYAGRPLAIEAVLASEDVLPPGEYPARLRIAGPAGTVWERPATVHIPAPAPGRDGPLAVPVLREEVLLDGPPGVYTLTADLERGGSPAGRRIRFRLADPAGLPAVRHTISVWGIDDRVQRWLQAHGATCRPFGTTADAAPPPGRELVLVGDPAAGDSTDGAAGRWRELVRRIARGSTAVFVSPEAFRRGDDPVAWLPLASKGRCYRFRNWLYHREDVARRHPIFAGLQAGGLLDWDYYDQVIPHYLFDGQPMADDVAAASFAVGYEVPGGCASGLLVGTYRLGAGRFVLNALRILEHVDRHPAADRLLLNLIAYGGAELTGELAPLPPDFATHLAAIGFAPQ